LYLLVPKRYEVALGHVFESLGKAGPFIIQILRGFVDDYPCRWLSHLLPVKSKGFREQLFRAVQTEVRRAIELGAPIEAVASKD